MKIIPAIDIINGKCVRLTQGDYNKMKVYKGDPLDVALEFQNADFEYLHLIDLDGAKKGKVVNWKIISELQEKTALLIDFGGGVKSEEDIEHLLELDISQINIGSMAIKEPQLFIEWLKRYGSDNFILGADVWDESVMIHGWLEPSELRLFELVEKYIQHGLKYLTCTDIRADGMLKGPNFNLYEKLRTRFPTLKITASGGISSLEDLSKLKDMAIDGAIIGKAIYEKKIKLEDLKTFQ
jgi:phosphoribosylformimino-5-aminoimidazole carboxamide ribotide isomerase